MKKSTPPPLALDLSDAAIALSCSRQHLYNLLADGEIRCSSVGSKRVIRVAELERYLASRQN